jgi:hypothetical protein
MDRDYGLRLEDRDLLRQRVMKLVCDARRSSLALTTTFQGQTLPH